MKKIMMLMLTLVLMLGIVSSAQAGIYVETLIGGSGEGEYESHSFDCDSTATIIGMDYAFDSVKLGMEYINGTWEDFLGSDIDFDAYELKAGYAFVNQEDFKIYGTLGYFNYEYDDYDIEANGTILGLELDSKLTEKSTLDGSIGFSVNGDINYFGNREDADVFLAKLKYTYYFTEKVGLGLGYRYYKASQDNSGNEFEFSGFTAGITFKF